MEDQEEKKEKKKKGSGIKLFGKILLGIFIFILLLLLFIRSPWGQNIITDKLVSYISNKTNTEVKVDKLYITFSGDLSLEGVYLEDKEGDTLIYSKELEADIPLLPIIKGNGIAIDELKWQGVRANINRQDTIEGFNYEFLMDVFAPADTTSTTATDTTSAMGFTLGDLDLKDFKIKFDDQVAGIDSDINLGLLKVEMQEFDLNSMRFELGNAELKNTSFTYLQTKPFPDQPKEEDPATPYFSVASLKINNVVANYQSVPDGFLTNLDIDKFLLKLPRADMGKQLVHVEMLGLKNSKVLIKTSSGAASETTKDTSATAPPFEWPKWKVKVDRISLLRDRIQYINGNAEPKKAVFDPNAIAFRELTFNARDIDMKPGSAEAQVEKMMFREISGIDLNKSNFKLAVTDEFMKLEELQLQLNGNSLRGNASVAYKSLAQFMEQPEKAEVKVSIPQFNLDLSDLYLFQPDLKQNEYFASLAKRSLYGSLKAEGKLSEVQIKNANINWGSNTRLSAVGTVFNASTPKTLKFDFPRINFTSQKGDIQQFIAEQELGIQLPQDISLTGSISGAPEDINVDAVLNSSAGKLSVDGKFMSSPQLVFEAEVEATKLEVGKLLQNKALGPVSLSLTASGEGENVNALDAVVTGNVSSLQYNNYTYEGIDLYAELENGEGFANVDFKDNNLNLELESFVELDSVAPKIALQLNLIGADLQALGISDRGIAAALDLKATFEGNAESYNVTANLTDGVAVYNEETYLLGDLDVLAHVRPDTTSLDIQNRMLNLRLSSNADPAEFFNALNRHYESYFSEVNTTDTLQKPVNIEMRAEVSPAPILEEVLLPQLEEMDTIHVAVDFNEKQKNLQASVNLPFLKYYGASVDSLDLSLNSNDEQLNFDLGLRSVDIGPLAIKQTDISGSLEDKQLLLDFSSRYNDEPLVNVQSTISKRDGVINIHVSPEGLVLNSKEWNIAGDNEIVLGDNSWNFNNFRLTRNDQSMRVGNDLSGVSGEHIGIHFENFDLAALLSYLNPEDVLASGTMNGNFIVKDPFGSTGLLADLDVREFSVMDVLLGRLKLDAEAIGSDRYNIDLAIKEGPADLNLTGSYVATQETSNLDLQLDLNEVKMQVVEGFAPELINNSSGSFSGRIKLDGTTANPVYDGNIHFNRAGFTVAMLDAPFVLPDETLRLDNKGFYMDNFEIHDTNGNALVVDGSVNTEDLLNPAFDLSFKADNFEALSSTAEDNDLFYGTAIFDATGSLTGDLELPVVELDLDVGENTDMTYVIPEATLGVEEREGVVVFVNRENPDRILTRTSDKKEGVSFSGFQLNSYISVQKNATFKVILDQETGDNFQASGEGDLLFDIYPNGRTTMSGRLEINDGHYEMSLYNLVTRKFNIMDGSSIVWAGDPMDADLNITAVYEVETSASALMAPQLTSADLDVKDRYRQELPFLVYLNINGSIVQPKISFGLDMPEDEQGAIGGQVYGRVQQVNQQENELNKQVFSLLVLNRFFPDSGSDGSSGGTLSFARDNLNEALSDQLNMFSDRLLGETGVNLNFGLDTYTDYQGDAPQKRTELDISAQKSLFNDRLVVSVGSEVDLQGSSSVNEESPVIGNVSLEYLLTEDGRFRLKAFRRKSFENVIDGQIIISGLSLIFTQEFNRFHELWNEIIRNEQQNKRKQKEKEKDQE